MFWGKPFDYSKMMRVYTDSKNRANNQSQAWTYITYGPAAEQASKTKPKNYTLVTEDNQLRSR